MIGRTISHYQISEKLGGGGMGVVYKAHDAKLDRAVALKFLPPHLSQDPEANERFTREAKAASAFDHPNICTIYDIGEDDDGQLFIAMAFYQGQTLKYHLADGLSIDESVAIAIQVAEGLARAHEEGIVHRDIKPANLMVTDRGRVKILDFGVAKLGGSVEFTKAGSTLGTVVYMSPEQTHGEEVDQRTDLWALGVVLYEMLTGERPFRGDYDQAVVYSILNEDPEPITALNPEVPEGLVPVVEKLLAKDPAERYQRVEDLLPDLTAFRSADIQSVEAAPSMGRWVTMGILAVLVLLGGLWALSRLGSEPAEPAASVARTAIAVLPFSVRGDEDLAYLQESMVDLLSLKLDGAGELRGIDPNALFGFMGDDHSAVRDLRRGQEVAAHLGAGYFILGSVTRLGDQIQFNATLYDVEGEQQTQAETTTPHENELQTAIDELARQLIAGQLTEPGQELMGVAALTTESLPALKAYLKGEQLVRAGQWEEAVEALQHAVDEDSTFVLAWYRLSVAFQWSGDHASAQAAIEKAIRNSNKLPSRVQELLVAEQAFGRGDAPASEQIYRTLLAKHPDDASAWLKLGDVLNHYNYLYGRPTSEAREYFERSLVYDPYNQEALYHLVTIALKAQEFDLLDSLLTRRFGEQWPLENRVYYAMVRGSTDQREAVMDELNGATPELIDVTAVLIAQWLEDLPVAQRVAKMLTVSTRSEVWQSWGHHRHGWFEVMRGRLQAAESDYASATSHEGTTLLVRVLDRMLPFYPDRVWELEALRDQVEQWDTTHVPFVVYEKDRHAGEYRAVKAYLLGLLSFRLGDDAAVEQFIEQLGQQAALNGGSGMAQALERTLVALLAWRNGETTQALAALDAAHLHPPYSEAWYSPLKAQTLNRYLRAELLFSEGQYEEALPWYTSLVDTESSRWGVAYLAPTYLRRAEIYEQLGDTENAITHYTRFIELWKDADAELQPQVEQAQERLNRLLEDTAREPGEVAQPGESS